MKSKRDYNHRRVFASAEQFDGIETLRKELQATTPVEISLQTVGRLVIEAGLKALRQQNATAAA